MRIQLISDTHLEFFVGTWDKFVNALDPTDVDVLVIAGDWATKQQLVASLTSVADLYPHVVYVTGNHEYYGTTPYDIHNILDKLDKKLNNFHWLQNDVVEIQDPETLEMCRFAGTTLWFPNSNTVQRQKHNLNDYHQIYDFVPWVYEENERALKFLEREAHKAHVVVTHHLPAKTCIVPKYAGDPFNCFFLCDVEHTITDQKPDLWLFGHTHDTVQTHVKQTKLYCNPYGYHGRYQNTNYNNKLVLEFLTL
tara:strand:+ start:2263 stop:3015 length:753 start_codon:yes stop_codon:yes gene_type:complete